MYCILKFCVHLAYKENQYKFRKHQKIKWLDKGLESQPLDSRFIALPIELN